MATDFTPNPAAPIAAKRNRLIWLDVARGSALIAMAVYHFGWDLEFFGYLAPGTTAQGFWRLFARAIASSFLFLAGFSLVLGHHPTMRWKAFGRRFAMIAAAAALISVATYFATPETFIFFGILHGIAAASLVGLFFLRLPPLLTLIAAVAVFAAPSYLRAPICDRPVRWWLGLAPQNPPSNDYVPVLPWAAPLLVGVATGRIAKSRGWLPLLGSDGNSGRLARLLAAGGRRSLLIYLVHQPVLIALIFLASLVVPPPAADPVSGYRSGCQTSCTAGQPADFCTAFCECTLGALLDADLFNPLMVGEIVPSQDQRTAAIANQCTADILGGNRP